MSENKSSFEKDYVTVRNMGLIAIVFDIIGPGGRKVLAFVMFAILVSMTIQSEAVRYFWRTMFECFFMVLDLIPQLIRLFLGL